MNKIILAILDGVGVSEKEIGNAYKLANKPYLNSLMEEYSHSLLQASGSSVGLPEGQMGNSEVGHLTIGAGRVIKQSLTLINEEIANGKFFQNEEILKAISHTKKNNSALHIFGLLSDGGVHSHIDHIFALIKLAKQNNVKDLYIHAFLDGRDTSFDSAKKYLDQLKEVIKQEKIGKIATISGRYYSMDREQMWDKTKLAYDVIVNAVGPKEKQYKNLLKKSYKKGIYDEFIIPTIINKKGFIKENDALILMDFRPDRTTQLFSAITNPDFKQFETKKFNNIKLVTLMPVEQEVICTNAYKPEEIKNSLGEVLANNNKKVLRIAEVSKFPHVTHFFDGDKEVDLINTTKIEVPRKNVDTYDLYPQMSSEEITDTIIREIKNYDFVLVNFANGDMVGHTGNFNAAVKAIEKIDLCIGRIYQETKDQDCTIIITSDHGNCEEMLTEDGNPNKTHTTNPVNFLVCNKDYKTKDGNLSDIAPSILYLLEIPIPQEMTGEQIISKLN